MTMTITDLPLDALVVDQELDFRSNGGDLEDLAASIAEHGLMQPITVAPANGDGKNHIIAGRRRFRAMLLLAEKDKKIKTIPAIVRDDMTSEKAQVIGQIIENLHREDITPMDEARSYAQLVSYDMKQKDVAAAVAKSPAHVSGRLALLKLPDHVVDKVERGAISGDVAVKLARAPKAVRDQVMSGNGEITPRSIAVAQDAHDQLKARRDRVIMLAKATGLPGWTPDDNWGYLADATIAENAGLTDDDKPKSHSWTTIDRMWTQSQEFTDEALIFAMKQVKGAKAFMLKGKGSTEMIMLIGSENLDLARKKQEEERAAALAERQAKVEKAEAEFEAAMRAIIASPDKATFISDLLMLFIDQRLGHFGSNRHTRAKALARLGLTVDIPADQQDRTDELEEWALRHRATKSSTDAVKVALSLINDEASPILIRQGLFDTFDVKNLKVTRQVELVQAEMVDYESISPEAQARYDEEEAAQISDAEAEAVAALEAEAENMYYPDDEPDQEYVEGDDYDANGYDADLAYEGTEHPE